MSRLQSIENALSSISAVAFQELCDSFLIIRNTNYSAFSRTGSQSGKQKTIKGTPDSFLLLPSGKYIFIEYSTNISAGVSKLEDDVKKCLDSKKTAIPQNQIAEIIICINYNLKATEVQQLKTLLDNTRIKFTIYTLHSLSLELHLNHRDLTHTYLGLVLDTGQVVSIETFVEEYNRASKGIATPLNNTFLHREAELNELKDAIQFFDFIILTGAPGVGKTRLALESIKSFLQENDSYSAYCISYKNHTLLNDLFQYFDSEKNYILFVDDANRIDAFNQITGFYKASRKGKLKIIITVRDYAFQEIGLLCQEFSPKRIDLVKLSDPQIKDIILAPPLGIKNSEYQDKILSIADGNPRLAIMVALLALAEQDIGKLYDVSDLFEKYFSTFIKDQGEFAKPINIKCLGIIAFFYTIPYKNKEIVDSILANFDIKYSEFIDVIDKLDKLELVEIQFEHVKVPEQNLATYFFYKAFIKDNLLSFEILLKNYFESNSRQFRDCVIPANNTFGPTNVMEKLQPDLRKYWMEISEDENKAFQFLDAFWFYMQVESLEFVYSKVAAMSNIEVEKYEVDYEDNAFSYDKDKTIELLSEFYGSNGKLLKEVLELSFEYVKKKPDALPELLHKIRAVLIFDHEDARYNFSRQTVLFSILLDGLNKSDLLLTTAFYELSKTFLGFNFRQTRSGRNHTFHFYEYALRNVEPIQDFRKNIWNALDLNFELYPVQSFDLLQNYMGRTPDVSRDIMVFELPLLIDIVNKHLSSLSFEHCKYVHDQIRWCKLNKVHHPDFSKLMSTFTNEMYEVFKKIDWESYRNREMHEYANYREFERLKEVEIRNSFVFATKKEVDDFYKSFVYLKKAAKNDWSYNTTIDIIIDENFAKNFEIGCYFLSIIIDNNNEIGYIPRVVFINNLKTIQSSSVIWNLLQAKIFKHRPLWKFSFFDFLDDNLITPEYVVLLENTVSEMTEANSIHFGRLERYLKLHPDLFKNILQKITEQNEDEGAKIGVWMDFFNEHYDMLGNDMKLIEKAYLQQDKIQGHFDYEGKGLLNILKRDNAFLIDFVNNIYSKPGYSSSRDHRNLGFVWEVDNIQPVLEKVFDIVIAKDYTYGILEGFCNSFFRNLSDESKAKAKDFLLAYTEANYENSKKINIIVDIARHTMKQVYDEILLLFLSLNQNPDVFSKIWWKGNGGTYTGNVIIGDIEAAEWRNILAIVERSNVGIKLIKIKKYINDQVEGSLRSGDWERQRRFLERD